MNLMKILTKITYYINTNKIKSRSERYMGIFGDLLTILTDFELKTLKS